MVRGKQCMPLKYIHISVDETKKLLFDSLLNFSIIIIFSDHVLLPLHVKGFMLYYDKPVFIYPQLLPTRTYHHEFITHPIGPSEEKY